MNVAVSTGQATSQPAAPGTRSWGSWWRGRYGVRLLAEIALCAGLLMTYRAIRTFTKGDLRAAFGNTREIIQFESWLGLPFEDNLQRWLLDHPALIKLLNHYYVWFHFPAAIALLVWLYLRHNDRYRSFRNLMTFVTFVALAIHLAFPLAPPRMMAGFVDTMRKFGPSIYPQNTLDGAANQIAAMPSLHFGWALIAAIAVISVLNTRWRWLSLIHPTLMTLSIIATANHWWIDAFAAGVIIAAAIGASRVISRWIGDRHWSWTRLRFQAAEGVAKLEAFANTQMSSRRGDRRGDQSADRPGEPGAPERVE